MKRTALVFVVVLSGLFGHGSHLLSQEEVSPLAESNPADLESELYDLGGQWELKEFMGLVSKVTGKQFIFTEADLNNKVIQFSDNLKIKGPTRLYQLFELVVKQQKLITKTEMGNKVRLERSLREHRYESWDLIKDEEIENLSKTYQIVTRVEEIANGNPKTIATQLQQLLNPDVERIIGFDGTNILIVTAYAHNVERIHRIIKTMDTKLDKMNVYIVPCYYALSTDLAVKVNQIIQHQASALPNFQQGRSKVSPLVTADDRTQNVIVVGFEEHYIEVKTLVEKLDIEVTALPSRFEIFPVANRTAEELVELINAIYEGKKALVDEQGIEEAPRPVRNEASNSSEGGGASARAAPGSDGGGEDAGSSGGGGGTTDAPRVVADSSTNSVIALSPSQKVFDDLRGLIRRLDIKQPQVFVEVTILEIGDNSERQLSFELLSLDNPSEGSVRAFAASTFGLSTVGAVDPLGGRSPVLGSDGSLQSGLVAGLFKDSADKIPVILRAIENNSDSTIVSVPRILTTNNKEATFEIRSEVPTARTDTTDLGTTTSFGGNEEAVTTLKITPSISLTKVTDSKGRDILDSNNNVMTQSFIRLIIDQQITRFVGESVSAELPPSKLERKATTEVTIPDDSTVVIGGFTAANETRIVDKVPYIAELVKKVPFLGTHILGPILDVLLRSERNTSEKSTLYMFVTPHIIPNFESLQNLRDRLITDEEIESLRDEYGLVSEIEKQKREEEAEKRRKKVQEENENMISGERRQLEILTRRWNQEGEEIRTRGENANLDDDDIEWEIATTRRCREDMFFLLRALENYRIQTGEYPSNKEGIEVLYQPDDSGLPPLLQARLLDPWSGQYFYLLRDDSPIIRSFGANRSPGGLGIDRDLEMGIVR